MKPATCAKLELLNDYKHGEPTQSIVVGFATVCLRIKGSTLHIASIHVHKLDRGKGHGQRALKAVLDVCDKHGCDASLRVHPFDGHQAVNRLRLWYEDNGFYCTTGPHMRRKPKGK